MKNSFPSSLPSTRLMYGFVILAYPSIGFLYQNLLKPDFDPMFLRVGFSAVLLIMFVLTFTSDLVKNHISSISVGFYYLITIHAIALTYANHYSAPYLMAPIILMMAVGTVIRSLKSLFFFSLILLPLVIDAFFVDPEAVEIHPYIVLAILLAAFFSTSVVIFVLQEYFARISLSQQVITHANAWVSVFDSRSNLVLSNIDQGQSRMDSYSWGAMNSRLKYMKNESFEFSYMTSNNTEKWINWNSSYFDEYKLCIGHDITDIKHKEKDLEEFAYVVSHDLKAPLRNVSTLSNFLKEDYGDQLPEDGLELLTNINDQVARMDVLIKGILEYSRTSNSVMQFVKVDLNKLVEEVKQMMRFPANFELTVDQLPMLKGDRIKLFQVFLNLIDNAIKHNSVTEPKLHISAKTFSDRLVVTFKDNGPGIDDRVSSKIFEIFKVGLSKSDTSQNAGVGLTTVKKCMKQHEGDVWVESTEGQGAKFKIFFPTKLIITDEINTSH